MPQLIVGKVDEPKHDKHVNAKIYAFMRKLAADDTSVGLHLEKMVNAVDKRARTARVDDSWRAVVYMLGELQGEKAYVYAGTWEHDEACRRAQTMVLRINPVTGLAELINAEPDQRAPVAAPDEQASSTPAVKKRSWLRLRGHGVDTLTREFGFPKHIAGQAVEQETEDDIVEFAASLENAWHGDVLVNLAIGTPPQDIKKELELGGAQSARGEADDDQHLIDALRHPAARMQFAFVEDDEELRAVIEGGDFAAWRTFLHPTQRRYVDRNYSGSYRLTGGAGTGKTVVLLHRARRLWKQNPNARIILTTFTRALAENLKRDLRRLDEQITLAPSLGEPGVYVEGLDQIASSVRKLAQPGYADSVESLTGEAREVHKLVANDRGWDAASAVALSLPEAVRSERFLASEYEQVILAREVLKVEQYYRVRRPGRGVALARSQRAKVWEVVEEYRKDRRLAKEASFAESLAFAAAWLNGIGQNQESRLADHVLIDEGQDLSPTHWLLARSLVGEGENDLFIAEDSHQRIYGRKVVLAHVGIKVVGRSRRLTLNYRTTAQNLRFALARLEGMSYTDGEGEPEQQGAYRSSRNGPEPSLVGYADQEKMHDGIRSQIEDWVDAGVSRDTIAILASTRWSAQRVVDALGTRVTYLKDPSSSQKGRPAVLTMHQSKGLEFANVVLYDISKGTFPNTSYRAGMSAEELEEQDCQDHSLLYVAASRARDQLVVTYAGDPSEAL